MFRFFKRIFDPQFLVSSEHVKGPLPGMGEVYRNCLSLAWPSALESVLIALVSSVDTMMVGGLGAAAISAVGITSQPRFLMMTPIIALNTGVTAIVARRKGEGNIDGACRSSRRLSSACFSAF